LRIDVFLKQSRLAPRRSLAQALCEAGAVTLNGVPAKSSREVRAGDQITIRFNDRIITARVALVPAKPPSKAAASTLYTILDDQHIPLM
jgi:ribosomal 50S subunit-recycling heat shock protein